jgi:hypothetical protein
VGPTVGKIVVAAAAVVVVAVVVVEEATCTTCQFAAEVVERSDLVIVLLVVRVVDLIGTTVVVAAVQRHSQFLPRVPSYRLARARHPPPHQMQDEYSHAQLPQRMELPATPIRWVTAAADPP